MATEAPDLQALPEVPTGTEPGLWDFLYKIRDNVERIRKSILNDADSWTMPYFLNGWDNYGGDYAPVAYHRDANNFVHIRGCCKNGTLTEDIFHLPKGYQPDYDLMFPVATDNDSVAHVTVYNDGRVEATRACSQTLTSLSGIIFKVTP